MYCPNCATSIDGVKFCRSCGANVSLVAQALSGELAAITNEVDQKEDRRKQPLIDRAITPLFYGIGFLLAAIIIHFFVPAGVFWGWSMLIPAFACLGDAIGHYIRWKENQKQQQFSQTFYPHRINQSESAPQIVAPTTSKISPPNSVTEVTTKNLDLPQRPE
jgi:hypothetical protein